MNAAPRSPSRTLQQYLRRIHRRVQVRTVSRGFGASILTALLLTLVCVFVANRYAFSDTSIFSARTILAGSLIAVLLRTLIWPLRRLGEKSAAGEAERSVPAFDGRIETFADQTSAAAQRGAPANPFLELLAEDTLRIADATPAEHVVGAQRVLAFAAVGLLSLFTLLWLGTSGPGYWGYGASQLWTGWIAPQEAPLYQIIVQPGDATVRQGADLTVSADIVGLETSSAQIFVLYAGGVDWEQAPMRRQLEGSGFEFLFAGVREPFRYYVSAAGIRGAEFDVDVVEMPVIQNLKLTYHYPQWTGMKSVTEDPGGDIIAVAGTEVEVEIETDKPLEDGVILIDGERVSKLTPDALSSSGRIVIRQDGQYSIAAMYGGEAVRLSEEYFITLIPDRKPEITHLRPGRDSQATNIEEVVIEVEGRDDFGVTSLDLYYSINGDEMQKVSLSPARGGKKLRGEHTLYLEEMGLPAASLTMEQTPDPEKKGSQTPPAPATLTLPVTFPAQGLVPGDVIAYYAAASDHRLTAKTDMYFLEVRPYDRSFTQSQAGGGGGGGEEGPGQNEISKRQKEILAATWNLIKKSDDAKSQIERKEIRENAIVLSDIQLTLRDQARTLVQRTKARELTGSDAMIQSFIRNLEKAAEYMQPAADHLAAVRLQKALSPAQKALQQVLRAEAIFRDIQLRFSRGGGGGGGQAQLDLAEMFELEMDLHKNQYETGGGAPGQQQEREVDELMEKLRELARRQQKLAERRREHLQATFAERWQQEMLRREAEELKRKLEQLQRREQAAQREQQQSGQQQGEQQQSGQQQGGQQQGQQQAGQRGGSPSSGRGAGGGGRQDKLENIIRTLEQATREMRSSPPHPGGGSRQTQDAASAQRAQERLESALKELAGQRRRRNSAALSDLASRAEKLAAEQRAIAGRLQEDLTRAVEQRDKAAEPGKPSPRLRSTLTRGETRELAARKKAMQAELEAIERKTQETIRRLSEGQSEAGRKLREALGDLQEAEVATRLRVVAEYIRRGLAPHTVQSEGVVTRSLNQFEKQLRQAERLASAAGESSEQGLDRSLSRLESLRRRLEQSARMGQGRSPRPDPGQQASGQQGETPGGQNGQQPGSNGQQQLAQAGQQQGQNGQQQGQNGQQRGQGQGQGQQPGQQGPSSQPGQGQQGSSSGQSGQQEVNSRGQRGGPQRTAGGASNFGQPGSLGSLGLWDQKTLREVEQTLRRTLDQIPELTQDLRRRGVDPLDLAELRKFTQGLANSRFAGNPQLLSREYRKMLSMLEQLELQVRRQVEERQGGQVRATIAQPVPEEYREAVAEYFRRLSKGRP